MLLAACSSSLLVTIRGSLLQDKEGGFSSWGGLAPKSIFNKLKQQKVTYQCNEHYNFVTFQFTSPLESLEGVREEPALESDFCSRG